MPKSLKYLQIAILSGSVEAVAQDAIGTDNVLLCEYIERLCINIKNQNLCRQAVAAGALNVLKWARVHGCRYNDSIINEAAASGRLEMVQWLRGDGCSWDEFVCYDAAKGGNLDVLKWARVNGCPCDLRTCTTLAAQYGQLEILQYIGCPPGHYAADTICRVATVNNHLHILQWMAAIHRIDPNNCTQLARQAFEHQAIIDQESEAISDGYIDNYD